MTTKTFEDEFLKIDGHIRPGCLFSAHVDAKPKLLELILEVSQKEVAKQVSIPGFRKGKMPIGKVMSVAKGKVHEQFVSRLGNYCVSEVSRVCNASPLRDVKSLEEVCSNLERASIDDLSSAVALKIEFEARPDVPSVEIASLDLQLEQEKDIEVNDKELAVGVMDTRLFFVKETDKGDAPAAIGDMVLFDILGEDGATRPYRLFLNEEFVSKEILDRVDGVKSGDQLELKIPMHKDGSLIFVDKTDFESFGIDEAEVSFRNKTKINVKTVNSIEIPDLSDEWVASLGAESVEDFRFKVRKQLVNRKRLDWLMRNRFKVQDALDAAFDIDLPASWVKETAQSMHQAHSDDKENLDDDCLARARRDIKMQLLLFNVANEHKLAVEPADYSGYVQRLVMSGAISMEQASELLSTKGWEGRIKQNVLLDKALDFIVHKALAAQQEAVV